ncbi:DUF167 family protein [soil metagenome]
MSDLPVSPVPGGVRLALRVKPNARKDEIGGLVADAAGEVSLLVKVRAQPEKGRANKAVIELLAAALGLAKSKLAVTAGETGRRKTIVIAGDADKLQASLRALIDRNATETS